MTARWLGATALAAATIASAATAANPTETIRLKPMSGARVTGTATMGAHGSGTRAALVVRGLGARASARALVHAGTCSRPSASFASAGSATAGAHGVARWTGSVRFRAQPVAWTTIADGAHVLAIVSGQGVVACGAIPGMS
jgi:hypothetical protein